MSKLWRRASGRGDNIERYSDRRGYSKAAAHTKNKQQQSKKNLNGDLFGLGVSQQIGIRGALLLEELPEDEAVCSSHAAK